MNTASLLFEKAKENIKAASLLIENGHPEIAAYGKEFAKTGLIDPELHHQLKEAFETRQLGDYFVGEEISKERAAEILTWAKEFLKAAREYLDLGD